MTRFAGVMAAAAALLLSLWHIGYIGGADFVRVRVKNASKPVGQHLVALYLSGDMGPGWGIDSAIADQLAARGVQVVSGNSLHFFRIRRTPEETGAMIVQGLRRALALDPGARLLLIGESFGADVIAPSLPYVPGSLRRRIALVALIGPGLTRQWRASPAGLLSLGEPQEDAVTAARRLSWTPLLCVRAARDTASLCPLLRQANAVTISHPGDHLRREDAIAVSAALMNGVGAIRTP
jgi:type IV secretory pathway VirJ component